jgi:hypothetical protein
LATHIHKPFSPKIRKWFICAFAFLQFDILSALLPDFCSSEALVAGGFAIDHGASYNRRLNKLQFTGIGMIFYNGYRFFNQFVNVAQVGSFFDITK